MDERLIFHVDVNSAFLSWEAVSSLHNGGTLDLRTVPSFWVPGSTIRLGTPDNASCLTWRFRVRFWNAHQSRSNTFSALEDSQGPSLVLIIR